MVLTVLAAVLLQDETYRIQAELAGSEENGKPVFVVSGMTDLPDGTLLYVDLFRSGTQEGTQLANRATRVEKMGFREALSVFPTRNLAGRYYVRLRFELAFQDNKAAGEAIVKSKRKTSAKGEAWLELGKPGDVEKEYAQQCRMLAGEMEAMESIARAARDKYASLRKGANPLEWKKEMAALKSGVSEIEHRNSDKVENRYYDLTEIADIGLEHLRNQVWALIEGYGRAAAAENPGPFEQETATRLETISQIVKMLKNKMNLPRVPTTDIHAIAVELKGYLKEALRACQSIEGSKAKARMIEEQRKSFETSLMDLAYAVSGDRYENVEELAQLANALFDTITRPAALDEPKSLQDVTSQAEKIESLIQKFIPEK